MDEKEESPMQADELPEPLEEYEPEPLLKSKNVKRGEAKIGRPRKTDEEKQKAYREGRDRINARRNEDRKLLAEEKAKDKEAQIIAKAKEDAEAQDKYEEEIFNRKLKQKEERDRKKAEEQEIQRILELEKAEKAQLIKRINELENQQSKPKIYEPIPIRQVRKPARLYL